MILEPGTRVSHRAAALVARAGALLVWVGEAGVRLYSACRHTQAWDASGVANRCLSAATACRYGLSEAAVLAVGDPLAVRLGCRDVFREARLLDRMIPHIEGILAAGEVPRPTAPDDAVGPAIPNPEHLGDAGHRA